VFYLIIKALLSGVIVMAVSEIARRSQCLERCWHRFLWFPF
jgi:hypothetical protein